MFWLALQRYPASLEAAQTVAFVTLCVSELVRAFTARSEYNSIFSIGVFSNKWMVWAVGASLLLVLVVVYVPFLQPFFDTVPLTLDDWLMMLPFIPVPPSLWRMALEFFWVLAAAIAALRSRRRRRAAEGKPKPTGDALESFTARLASGSW